MNTKQVAWQYTKHLWNFFGENYAVALWFFSLSQFYSTRLSSGYNTFRWYCWIILGIFFVIAKLSDMEKLRLAKLEEEKRQERYRRSI